MFFQINTAMINMELPFEMQQQVRHSLFQKAPTQKVQMEIKSVFELITPSLRYKVTFTMFYKILDNNAQYAGRNAQINDMVD